MEIELNIKREDILGSVKMLSSYVGKSNVDANGDILYPKILIKEQDVPLISTFIDNYISLLRELVREFLIREDDEKLVIAPSARFDELLEDSVKDNSYKFIYYGSFSSYLMTIQPNLASGYVDTAASVKSEIKRILYYKKPPTLVAKK